MTKKGLKALFLESLMKEYKWIAKGRILRWGSLQLCQSSVNGLYRNSKKQHYAGLPEAKY